MPPHHEVPDASEHLVAELIHGTLHTHPRPTPRHARASSILGGTLGSPFDCGIPGPRGWWIFDEPALHFGEQVLVPDLAGWCRERMPELPDTAYFALAPDWVCEVPSRSTRRLNLLQKAPICADEGVAHLWLVEPTDRTLEAFVLRDGRWVLIASVRDDEWVAIRPFETETFSLGDLWA